LPYQLIKSYEHKSDYENLLCTLSIGPSGLDNTYLIEQIVAIRRDFSILEQSIHSYSLVLGGLNGRISE